MKRKKKEVKTKKYKRNMKEEKRRGEGVREGERRKKEKGVEGKIRKEWETEAAVTC